MELAAKEFVNILVVKLRTLGDVLTTFPLLRALKERYPQSRLTMITDENYHSILETNPRLDALWLHPVKALRQNGQLYAAQYQLGMLRKIRREKFDLFIDLYGSLRTAVWGFGGGIPHRMGFALRGRKYFYNHPVIARCRYVVDLNLQFAQILGWQGHDNQLEFFVTAEDEAKAKSYLEAEGWDSSRPYMVVSVGGGWALKQWGAERFSQVINEVAARTHAQVVLSGSREEEALMDACARGLRVPHLRAVGLPLRQLASVIKGSRIFLGNDSGPKYFAEAFGVPTVICYGPTDFINNNPESPRHQVAYHAVPCRPCHSEICRLGRRACLDDLPVNEVVQLVMTLWQAGELKSAAE